MMDMQGNFGTMFEFSKSDEDLESLQFETLPTIEKEKSPNFSCKS